MIVDLMEKPLSLDSEMARDLGYILDRSYTFDERSKLIEFIKEKLTKKDVIDYFNEFIFLKAKRLEVALYSSVNKEKEKEGNKMDIEENDNIKNENDVKEESNVDMVEVKNIDKKGNDANNNYVLPSYQNVQKVIIKDIQDFHRHCVYYDNEFY